jgi:tetratricopeptide (TPR) repeat protein
MEKVQVTEKRIIIPTYIPAEQETLPMFAENRVHQRSSGNPYPNQIINTVQHNNLKDTEYDCIVLENKYLYLEILPEIGGRIFTALDKTNGYNFFYHQHVIKPALIGMLGLWVSGGVEFNWPIHHRPSTFLPVDSFIEHHTDGAVTVWLSEHEPLDRMKGMVGIYMKPNAAMFETKVKIFNRTDIPHSFLWWENAAVPVSKEYRIFFPPDVQYVNYHYKKATGGYPVMDEFFNTQDNRGGNDIRFHKNTEQATSYFSGPSKFDFFGGYDEGKKAGVIHYASHHTSVGKKMFTWGYRALSRSWESALTDKDGQYAELMASSYSDNQPDFSWIEPFEIKEFSQSWYPYKEIGEVHQANDMLALSVQEEKIGLYPIVDCNAVTIKVMRQEEVLYESILDLVATEPHILEVPSLRGFTEIVISNTSSVVLKYKPVVIENHPIAPPSPQKDYPQPCDINTAEEAFQTGLHVAQYRDPIKEPDLYWDRALEIEPHHIPSLIGMSWYALLHLHTLEAEQFARKAFSEQTRLNPNPPSSWALYFLGLSLKYSGNIEEAEELLHKGLWNRDGITCCSFVLAQIACMKKQYKRGLSLIEQGEHFGAYNQKAQQLKISILRRLGQREVAITLCKSLQRRDPLDYYAINEAKLLDMKLDPVSKRTDQTQMLLDVVSDYLDAGLEEEATKLLEQTKIDNSLISYIRFHCTNTFIPCDKRKGFPSRRWELLALQESTKHMPGNEEAFLLLGDIQYGIQRDYQKALAAWSNAGTSAQALRNQACALFKCNPKDKKVLEFLRHAMEQEPYHLQLCYEYLRVLELTETDIRRRIEAFELMGQRTRKRDDLYLLGVHTYNQASQFQKALTLLDSHHFVPCEGGEHAIANEYLLANLALALEEIKRLDWVKAIQYLEKAQQIPHNLGGGVWHQVMLTPYQYLEGVCKEQIEPGAGCMYFETVYGFPINYFTTMYLPSFPIIRALAARKLGKSDESNSLVQSCIEKHETALGKPISGYFEATPFFETFIEDPSTEHYVFHSHLLALSKAANHEFDSSIALCNTILEHHYSRIRTRILRDSLKTFERHGIV